MRRDKSLGLRTPERRLLNCIELGPNLIDLAHHLSRNPATTAIVRKIAF
jgi:hypothetical protein